MSQSRSKSPNYRNRTSELSKIRPKSESCSPYRKITKRNKRSTSRTKHKITRSRSRSKRNYRSRSISSSSSSSYSSRSSKSRSKSKSVDKNVMRESPKRIDSPKPVQRYYGRRQEDKSSSDLSESEVDDSKPSANSL